MKKVEIICSALFVALSGPAFAHDQKGPHGGFVEHAGSLHVEMVANGMSVDVFVLDAAMKPVAAAGYKGLAILVVGGKPARIPLEPNGDDRLSGKTTMEISGHPKGAVQITPASGATVQAKFD